MMEESLTIVKRIQPSDQHSATGIISGRRTKPTGFLVRRLEDSTCVLYTIARIQVNIGIQYKKVINYKKPSSEPEFGTSQNPNPQPGTFRRWQR